MRIASSPPNQAGERRHGEARVLGEHVHHRVDVVPLPGLDVALDDLPEPLVAELAQRRLLALLGHALLDRLPRALEALFTDATEVSSESATSWAEKPSTSRRIRTARWFAGSSWSAATNASSTLSRCS